MQGMDSLLKLDPWIQCADLNKVKRLLYFFHLFKVSF